MTDPNFSGINPDNLMKTIDSLVSGSETLQQGKNSFIGRFRKFGLETTHLTELGRIASWVDDELPMLRRRQALAAAMEFDGVGPKPPTVQVREPVWTVKQAHAEGKKLAEEAEGLAEMGPDEAGPAFHRIAQELAKHGEDPDFASAFYAAMDPEVVKNLPVAIAAAGAKTAKEDARAFGAAFTAAVGADKPAPGFRKIMDVFHGDLPEDDPGALFGRVLTQGDDPDLWDRAWHHLTTALTDLGDPKKTWTVHAGLVAGVIGIQSNLADKFWDASAKLAQDAKDAYHRRINAMTPKQRAEFRKETRLNAKASKAAARQAEQIFAKYGMGTFSRLMELSVGDSARWLADKVPYIKARPGAVKGGWMGKLFRAGGRVPLVGSLLTIGGIAYDIKVNGSDPDVAVASNVASLGAGMAGTWMGVAGVAALGGPVGWGVTAGIVVGVGLGYAAYYTLNTPTGQRAVKAVTNTARNIGKGVEGAARKVGSWLGL